MHPMVCRRGVNTSHVLVGWFGRDIGITPRKTNMDTQNDGLEEVSPFKHGNCWYLC